VILIHRTVLLGYYCPSKSPTNISAPQVSLLQPPSYLLPTTHTATPIQDCPPDDGIGRPTQVLSDQYTYKRNLTTTQTMHQMQQATSIKLPTPIMHVLRPLIQHKLLQMRKATSLQVSLWKTCPSELSSMSLQCR